MKKKPEEMDTADALREFVNDIEAVYTDLDDMKTLREEWPDLAETYDHAVKALLKRDRMRHDSQNTLTITKWLKAGELSGPDWNIRDLLESLGNLLDRSRSHDIFGDIIFEAEDGVTYVATVEGVIAQANPDYVKEILIQDALTEEED